MAPPAVAVIVLGVAAGATTIYLVKEYAWEPHIEPQLQKLAAGFKHIWAETAERRRTRPMQSASGFFSRKKDEAPSSGGDDTSALERLVNNMLPGRKDGPSDLRSRKNAGPEKSEVEMMELDKSNAFISHVPLTPSRDTGRPASYNPFTDDLGLTTPPASDFGASLATYGQSGSRRPLSHTNSASSNTGEGGLPLSFPSAHSAGTLLPNLSSTHAAHQRPDERSPFSDTHSLSASTFSWTDGAESQSAFDDGEDEVAFSIGSFDDADTHVSSVDSSRGDDEDSDSGDSENGAGSDHGHVSVGSWESVGSPSSQPGRQL